MVEVVCSHVLRTDRWRLCAQRAVNTSQSCAAFVGNIDGGNLNLLLGVYIFCFVSLVRRLGLTYDFRCCASC